MLGFGESGKSGKRVKSGDIGDSRNIGEEWEGRVAIGVINLFMPTFPNLLHISSRFPRLSRLRQFRIPPKNQLGVGFWEEWKEWGERE